MNRPTGVTVIAVLDFLGAALLVCVGLLAFVGMGFLATLARASSGSAIPTAVLAGMGVVIGVVVLFFAAISAIIGYGILNLKEWARIIQMVFAGIAVVFGGLGLLASLVHFQIIGMFISAIRVGIGLLIFWYLMQPQVKAAFAGQSAAAGAV